ncbi:MAG: SMR family transporter [Micrococcus sp.]|nr:SMR family transporter [Micrococcus sp.]
MKRWGLLIGAVLAEVTGSLTLKAALETPPLYGVTAASYLVAFSLLAGALRQGMPLGAAYGIWAASGVALTATLSAVLFGEPMNWTMGLGILVIITGVLCVELGSHAAGEREDAELPGKGRETACTGSF